ncbi:hypothetical protein trd_0883 [Thermomicrobium roseum DSM 5159]|uniref:Uncharacterized protein n=1 Tax=Thermomicrobium roseum (strain ATCC 27502 / DSM 5159 / P-2) TaxID=309801 RepID=B9KZG3_THERP|nr:hypothetical protein trd_0883 [Thermomicrobium roseum DSM 5159]
MVPTLSANAVAPVGIICIQIRCTTRTHKRSCLERLTRAFSKHRSSPSGVPDPPLRQPTTTRLS